MNVSPGQLARVVAPFHLAGRGAFVLVRRPYRGEQWVGTTGVACAQLGRVFTGIERERRYFDIACERISRAQAQGSLLPPESPQPEQLSLDA